MSKEEKDRIRADIRKKYSHKKMMLNFRKNFMKKVNEKVAENLTDKFNYEDE